MSEQLHILVIGATGQQGGAVARRLLSRGHRVRAFTRSADSASARELKSLGAELAIGDNDDRDSVIRAAEGVDVMYAMSTFFEAGLEAEVRQGKNLADAAKAANVPYLVYASVGSADRSTGIPHFESKYQIEQHIKSLRVPYAIVAPVYFMDNLLGPWVLPGLAKGTLAMPVPPHRPVQQISVRDIASFVTFVIENRDRFIGKRIDIASDELDGVLAAETLTKVSGHQIGYNEVPLVKAYEMSEDAAKMFEWFDTVGYTVDIKTLRKDFPQIGWQTLKEWAQTQDWSVLDADGDQTVAA